MSTPRKPEPVVGSRTAANRIYCGDSRNLGMIEDGVVDLVICSPPYNVGKNYQNHDDALPLGEYLSLLCDVWKECSRVLRPGARICVNVAGVDRQPYLPLQSYITQQLIDLGFLMRGEIIWDKAASVGVSTAWGSWQSPSNPTLRDVHEFILVFCKEQFRLEETKGETDLTSQEFTALTRSVWQFATESASKVGHPAPFPVELPRRLIKLYSWKGALVLDPFCGSGSTCVAAAQLGRLWIGVDTDPTYVALARRRISAEAGPSLF
ncbi:MAG: site-specific DNA-methyltransferase [Armatimonadota bacterium]|nr:MAG: site-specific DNA-methyltransferase [Armatimonadota bacterium]